MEGTVQNILLHKWGPLQFNFRKNPHSLTRTVHNSSPKSSPQKSTKEITSTSRDFESMKIWTWKYYSCLWMLSPLDSHGQKLLPRMVLVYTTKNPACRDKHWLMYTPALNSCSNWEHTRLCSYCAICCGVTSLDRKRTKTFYLKIHSNSL